MSVTNQRFQHTHFPFRHLEIFNSIKKSMSLTKFQIVAVIFAKGCQATLSPHNAYILWPFIFLEVLCRALKIMDSLKVVSVVCVFDQAIYIKACEIKWRESSMFGNCVLMMGMFHMMTMFMNMLLVQKTLSSKLQWWQRGRLKWLFVESATTKVCDCRNYETLMRLLLDTLAETKELDRENLFSDVYSGSFLLSKTLFYSLKFSETLQTLFNQLQDRFSGATLALLFPSFGTVSLTWLDCC